MVLGLYNIVNQMYQFVGYRQTCDAGLAGTSALTVSARGRLAVDEGRSGGFTDPVLDTSDEGGNA